MRVRSISHLNRPMAATAPRPDADVQPASLSEREAARYIGMSAAWLKKSRTKRCLGTTDAPPFVRCGARRIVYRRVDLDEWQRDRVATVGHGDIAGGTAAAVDHVELFRRGV